jgi:hypothetical protein
MSQSNHFGLYFEEENLEAVEKELLEHGFEFIHRIKEEPWKQQVFRFYDYDQNILVIADSMEKVSYRLFKEKNTIDEISKMTGLPVDQVLQHIEEIEMNIGSTSIR